MAENASDLVLIQLLADGRFHSGAALGEALSISRAAIWKRVQRLSGYGLVVESVRGKGYRLSRPLDLINADALAAEFAPRARVHYRAVTGSTNADALALAAAEETQGPALWITECQQAGRGRRGRRWQSPFAANLYLSVLYPLSGGFGALGGLSLAAGVAVSRALSGLCPDLAPGLKWPNDLMVDGAKLGGVLIEVAGEMEGRVQVVVGVGLNVAMTDAQAQGIDQSWVGLNALCAEPPPRTALATAVGEQLLTMLERFAGEGFAPLMAEFQRLDLCLDRPVTVYTGTGERSGIARGVAEDGALRVEIDGEIHFMHGGEVSLRLQ